MELLLFKLIPSCRFRRAFIRDGSAYWENRIKQSLSIISSTLAATTVTMAEFNKAFKVLEKSKK
jgi:hypothetical protein